MAINLATGEKIGTLLQSIGMTASGVIIGIINGWNLALAYLAVAPILIVGMTNFGSKVGAKFI